MRNKNHIFFAVSSDLDQAGAKWCHDQTNVVTSGRQCVYTWLYWVFVVSWFLYRLSSVTFDVKWSSVGAYQPQQVVTATSAPNLTNWTTTSAQLHPNTARHPVWLSRGNQIDMMSSYKFVGCDAWNKIVSYFMESVMIQALSQFALHDIVFYMLKYTAHQK